jgi:hypothetical protein
MVFIKGSDGIARSLKENKDVTYRYADSDVATFLPTNTANIGGANINSGNLIATGQVVSTGNVSGGNITTAGAVEATGLISSGTTITATGNVTGGNLTTGGDVTTVTVTASGAIAGSTTITATGNVVGGNIITGAQVVATGDITGANVIVSLGGFVKNPVYTISTLTAITGQVGWVAVVSDSATTNGMLAFWDTTNSRWSYVLDNSAVV